MAERRPLNSENGWLSTRNKTKMTPKQTIGKRRGSLPKFKVISSPFLLTQNSPPPKQLLAATKQTAVTHFFKPTAQASIDDRVDYQPDTETMPDSPVDTSDNNDNTYNSYTQSGECFTSYKGEHSDTDDDHNHSSSRSYTCSRLSISSSSLLTANRHKQSPNNASCTMTTTKGNDSSQDLILSVHNKEIENVSLENSSAWQDSVIETNHRTCVDGSDSISFTVKNAAYGERARKRRPSDELDSLQCCVKKQRKTVQHSPKQVDGYTAELDMKNIVQDTPSEHNDCDSHFTLDSSRLSAIEFDTVVNHTNSNDSPITPKSRCSRDVFGTILNSELYDDNHVNSASNADVTNVDDDSELAVATENHDVVSRHSPVDESINIELSFSLASDSEFTLRSQRLKFDRLQANVNAILGQNDEDCLSFDTDSQFHF